MRRCVLLELRCVVPPLDCVPLHLRKVPRFTSGIHGYLGVINIVRVNKLKLRWWKSGWDTTKYFGHWIKVRSHIHNRLLQPWIFVVETPLAMHSAHRSSVSVSDSLSISASTCNWFRGIIWHKLRLVCSTMMVLGHAIPSAPRRSLHLSRIKPN